MAKGDPRAGGGGTGYFPAVYQSAISQSAEDYDNIMGQYKGLGDSVRSNPSSSSPFGEKVNYSPISPQFTDYVPGSDFSQLRDIASTGGYSGDDVSNIRERAISPIRSIYSSANRNLLRQKNLSGGYSPNFAAASAKMAREQSGLISGKTTDANAAIAEMVQRGKLAGATNLAPLEAQEAARRQAVTSQNTSIANNANIFNTQNQLDTAKHNTGIDQMIAGQEDNDFNKILESIRGQQSTYGTTPAIASTFGNQALQAANTVNNFAPITRSSMSSGGGARVGGYIPYRPNISGFSAGRG